ANPETYLPDVAMTLINLGNLYHNQNDVAAAQAAYDEALGICRRLADTNPDTYLPDVALTLNNLAVLYSHRNDVAAAQA
ncbi:MAG: tetratricopeptide repeat protein, partial [Nitrospira sp.]|nr:tetratricopeptide repeat protein [Nitrospira sp.]